MIPLHFTRKSWLQEHDWSPRCCIIPRFWINAPFGSTIAASQLLEMLSPAMRTGPAENDAQGQARRCHLDRARSHMPFPTMPSRRLTRLDLFDCLAFIIPTDLLPRVTPRTDCSVLQAQCTQKGSQRGYIDDCTSVRH